MKSIDNDAECYTSEIQETWEVLDLLAFSPSMVTPVPIENYKKTTYIWCSRPVFSAKNTLISIDFCVQRGFLSDAFVLLRKYRDDLMLSLFLYYKVAGNEINPINFTLDDLLSLDCESFLAKLKNFYSEIVAKNVNDESKNNIVRWAAGEYTETKDKQALRQAKSTFSAQNYYQTFDCKKTKKNDGSPSEYIQKVFDLINSCYCEVGRKLNNYVHVNSPKYLSANGFLGDLELDKTKNDFIKMMRQLTIIFLGFLAMVHPCVFSTDEYINHIEETGFLKEGLQYCVPPGIVAYLEKYSDIVNEKLLEYIRDNNPAGMDFTK